MCIVIYLLLFEVLLYEYCGIIFKVVIVYVCDLEDCCDLVQEICVQLWCLFGCYDVSCVKLLIWMYCIVFNVVIFYCWCDGVLLVGCVELLDVYYLDMLVDFGVVEEDECLIVLYVFIGEFDVFNCVLILLYLEDCSYVEIVEVLGISEINVVIKIGCIKQKLCGCVVVVIFIGV